MATRAELHGSQSCRAAAERSGMEAAEIILNLCDELGKKCRDKEVIALTKALMSLYTMDDLRQDAKKEGH